MEPSTPITLTPEWLGAIVGTAVSILFLLVPKLNVWFVEQEVKTQQSIMAIVTLVIASAIYLLACIPGTGFTLVLCPVGGIQTFLLIWVATVIGNQSVYRIIPKPSAVLAAITRRELKVVQQ